MLAAAAFCPHPPLIVPEVAAGAAAELDGLRAACDLAVAWMLAARPVLVVVVGAGPVAARWTAGAAGTLAGYGVDVTVPLDGQAGHGGTGLPLSVTVGAWLLARAGWAGERVAVTVPAAASDSELSDVAAQVVGEAGLATDLAAWLAGSTAPPMATQPDAAPAGGLGLLVMGDGSARRSAAAPGYVDGRAAGFDSAVAAALAAADTAALRVLDPGLGAELLAAGVPAWRLAGHVGARAGGGLTGTLHHHEAPYGVGYLVASWTRADRARAGGAS